MRDPQTVVIIPFRDRGDPWRRKNLGIVINHLEKIFTAINIVDDGGTGQAPFNRSAAYNRGVQLHPADVYVFHEADMIIPHRQLIDGIATADDQPGLVIPFHTYHYLSPDDTLRIHHGHTTADACTPHSTMTGGRAVGAVNIINNDTMAAVGQWDQTFFGWGYDDRAMALAFTVCTGNPSRCIPGIGYHLWHVPGAQTQSPAATKRNRNRYRLYQAADTPQRIRELTAGQ